MLMLLKCIARMTEWLHLASLARSDVPGRTPRAAAAYLHPGLGQVDLHRQLLPGEDVRVVGLSEHSLQSLQLHGHKAALLVIRISFLYYLHLLFTP